MRTRYGVDGNLLVVTVLQNYFGERASVAVSTEVDDIDHLPLIIVDAMQGQSVPDSPVGFVWQWMVNLEILAEGIEECADLSDELHEYLESFSQSWDMSHGIIPGIGAITGVEVTSIPTKTASTALPAGNLTQFNGSFNVMVQKTN